MQNRPIFERPFINLLTREIEDLVYERWDDPHDLRELFTELLFRSRMKAVRLRQKVVSRLQEFGQDSFPWPSTAAFGGGGGLDDPTAWPQQGLLAYVGYRVGFQHQDEDARRSILNYVYLRPLPNVNSPSYMDAWGQPQTGKRLQKMANSIAAFCRNAKRRNGSRMQMAIQHWESDLEYLHDEFYIGRYDFTWPSTELV